MFVVFLIPSSSLVEPAEGALFRPLRSISEAVVCKLGKSLLQNYCLVIPEHMLYAN